MMNQQSPIRFFIAVALSVIACVNSHESYAHDDGVILIEDPNSSNGNGTTRPRTSAHYSVIVASFTDGILAFPEFCGCADSAEVMVATPDGIIYVSGIFSAEQLASGLYIGETDSINVIIILPDGSTFVGSFG